MVSLSPHGSGESLSSHGELVYIEILTRLPVKSLMRFKCVCKNWCFLIQKDTTFIKMHSERSKARPRLLICNRLGFDRHTLMTTELIFGGRVGGAVTAATFHTIREIDITKGDVMLKPVNGLMGFFRKTRVAPGVCLYNPSTREITPWIESKLLRYVREKDHEAYKTMATCTLGYDPASKKHKVVGIWMSLKRPTYEVCEVLTVGENEWRRIDEVPPYSLECHGSCVYIDGSIYYSTDLVTMCKPSDKEKFIVAFDVGSEKFRTIRVPNCVFDQPDYNPHAIFIFYDVKLLELDGRLGLLIEHRVRATAKLWLFEDDSNKNSSTGSWTQVTMELPYPLNTDSWDGISLNPISGTNQVILSSYVATQDGKISNTTYHSYNWKKKSFNEIEFSGIPSSVPFFTSESRVATFYENLLPVQKQTL